MKRRLFSLSLVLSALPVAARRFLAFPARKADEEVDLHFNLLPTQPRPAGTVALLPIGYEGRRVKVVPVSEVGKIFTQTVSFDLTVPGGPQIRASVEAPLIKMDTLPPIPVSEAFRLVGAAVDFGDGVGVLPYTAIVVQPTRAWTTKGVRVAAVGEPLTVRTLTGEEAPLIVTEELGFSPLVQVSQALRQLLQQQGVNIDDISKNAIAPNLRQRVLLTTGGGAAFVAPDPPLAPDLIKALGTIQVTISSPVPIAVLERAG